MTGDLKFVVFVVSKFVAFILPPAQRLRVLEKFKQKLQEEAKETQGTRNDLTSSPNGEKVKKSTHTDKELAKMDGVGTGTVASSSRSKFWS